MPRPIIRSMMLELDPQPGVMAAPNTGVAAPARLEALLIATRARVLGRLTDDAHMPCLVMDCAAPPRGRTGPHHWQRIDFDTPSAMPDFDAPHLIREIAALPRQWSELGVLYGAGFDHRPELLSRISRHHRLLGNEPDTLSLLADPVSLAEIARHLKLPHAAAMDHPPAAPGWLARHVDDEYDLLSQPARAAQGERPGRYYQQDLPGRRMLALFAADGRRTRVLGHAEYLLEGARRLGAVTGSPLPPAVADDIAQAANRLTRELGLVGVNRLDFCMTKNTWAIERLTPRLCDEMALFEGLASVHRQALEGLLPEAGRSFARAPCCGLLRLFASSSVLAGQIHHAAWVLDAPPAGQVVRRGQLVGTVLATAHHSEELASTLRARACEWLDMLAPTAQPSSPRLQKPAL